LSGPSGAWVVRENAQALGKGRKERKKCSCRRTPYFSGKWLLKNRRARIVKRKEWMNLRRGEKKRDHILSKRGRVEGDYTEQRGGKSPEKKRAECLKYRFIGTYRLALKSRAGRRGS